MIEIVNVSRDWAIGKRGQLLIHIPADLRYFRQTTAGKVCIMGSTTLESFPRMAPLKGRVNIVLIDDARKIRPESLAALEADRAAGGSTELFYVRSPEEALEAVRDYPKDDVFVIGGASIYRLFLPYCDTCLVTHNDYPSDGADTFYPDLAASGEWQLTEEGEPQEYEGTTFRFCRYERILP
ncbi:MAG: dihydrofolate reductase [Clostridia bacterium]|nr:dihydrofolate reductase [Clostridia bacterium]